MPQHSLQSAITAMNPQGIRQAMADGADVNQALPNGEMPLVWAVQTRDIQTAGALIETGRITQAQWDAADALATDNDDGAIRGVLRRCSTL